MLATIRDDTWNVLNIQHITPNSKRQDYSDTPGGGHKKIEGPAHMVEGGHHLRKAPNPHHHGPDDDINKGQWDQAKSRNNSSVKNGLCVVSCALSVSS